MGSSNVKIILFLSHFTDIDAVHVKIREVPYTWFLCAVIYGAEPEDSTNIDLVSNTNFNRGKLILEFATST